ncbi:hypothetical protein Hanom_Chr01g00014291 [Helianthus anomalus]
MNDELVKKLQQKVDDVLVENKKLIDREKKLEKRVKTVEAENSSLLKRVDADQAEIDIMKVRIAELEEEKARRDEQNEYFRLKNKELETINAKKEHEMYMMNKVLENLLGKSVEQKFEEIELEEVRARRKAEIEAEMKNKGKGIQVDGVYFCKGIQVDGVSEVTERAIVPAIVPESPIQNPRPISAVSGIFEEDVEIDDVVNEEEEDDEDDEEEEEDDEAKKDDADDMFSASSHDDDDDDGYDDDQGTSGIKVTEESNEDNVDDYPQDDVNEEPEDAEGEGEHVDDQNVDDSEKLILHLEPDIEEGEIRHTYTLDEIIKLTHIDENEFKFDFEEELNEFYINQQHEYEYKYVEDADNYDRVEVEDCSDEESVNVDTSNFPMLVEFFSQANIDELRRKVEECLKNKNFDGTSKDERREERKKWLRKHSERKFKRPLKFYKRDKEVSLGDIISNQLGIFTAGECICYPKRILACNTLSTFRISCLYHGGMLKNFPRVENEVRHIYVYDPLWLVNCSAEDIECLFMNKIRFKAEDKDQAMQFQKVVTICFQKGINYENAWSTKWRKIEKEEALKAEKERQEREKLRGKWMKIQAEEKLQAAKENEKMKSLLKRKPKQREEKFKSL